uniref:C2 domain-containing protein n=1 Tax=Chenopodium quinoa TaxID=63459 RepID=A0A803N2W3_CHEQI
MGSQSVKTQVIKKNCNPEWNDVLTLSVTNPNIPIKLAVYDHDTFTKHDRMGDATIDIRPYIECMQMGLGELPIGTAAKKLQPNENNCLADESKIVWTGNGKMVQDMILKLQHVERGKLQIQLEWLDLPGNKG